MNWKSYSLAELGYVARGRSRHRPRDAAHLYGGPYPFVQTGDIKHADLYVTSYSQTYSEAGLAQSKLWPKGTLCITIAANIADTAILGFEACFPDSVIGFLADLDKCDAKFIKYKFDILKHQYQQFSQGAAQDNLSQEKLLSVKFLVPNLSTQRRIAGILSAYDDLIENNRRRIQLLEQAARLIYQEWFVRLCFPGHEHVQIVDGVPEGWEWHTLGELCASLTDGDWVESKDQSGEDFRLLQVSNIGTNGFIETGNYRYISEETFRRLNCREVVPGDILISRMPKPVGRAWLVTAMPWRMITAVDVAVAAVDEEQVSPLLVLYYLNSPSNFQQCETYITGATRPRITRSILRSFRLLVPPRRLQRMFDRQIEPIQDQMVKLRQTNEKLRQARDLLLPKLMSGEIEV